MGTRENSLLLTCCLFVTVCLCGEASSKPDDVAPLDEFYLNASPGVMFGPGLAALFFGPDAEEPVTLAKLDVTFDASGPTLASEIQIQVILQTEGGQGSFSVTGADLGFPASLGVYSGSYSTEALNGVVVNSSPFPSAPLEVITTTASGSIFGEFQQMDLRLEHGPVMQADVASVSISSGGSQALKVSAGRSAAGDWLLIAGSATAVVPGLIVDGVCIPLVPDTYTDLLLQQPNTILSNSFTTLDPVGSAVAVFSLPGQVDPSLAGVVLHHSALVIDATSPLLRSASAPVGLSIAP